jgi:hypothetical protein
MICDLYTPRWDGSHVLFPPLEFAVNRLGNKRKGGASKSVEARAGIHVSKTEDHNFHTRELGVQEGEGDRRLTEQFISK